MLLVLAIVLLIALPSPWGLLAAVTFFVGFLAEIATWQKWLGKRKAAVGAHTLVGRTGRVVSDCAPAGQVRIGGEIWAARCEAEALEGQTVRVHAVDELTLVVEPER
ncbi:MAG: NfeD family protein [Thermoleophilia bacterium]|nr:NfeD family protein [Thermoleophilia bacterium]